MKNKNRKFCLIQTYNIDHNKYSTQKTVMADTTQRLESTGSPGNFIVNDKQQPMIRAKKTTGLAHTIKKVLISIPLQIVITLLTIYSLVGDDIRIIAATKSDDINFDIFNIILILIFSIEIILSSFVLDNYFLSFFFWLDCISSISLLFDISMFTDIIYASSSTNSYTFSKVAAQSKASRAAIRAIRVVKLFRLIRIIKIYKSALKVQEVNEKRRKQQQIKEKLKLKFEQKKTAEQDTKENFFKNDQEGIILQKSPKNDMRIHPEDVFQNSPKTMAPKITFPHLSEDQIQESQIQRKPSAEQVNELLDSELLEQIEKKESKIRRVMGEVTLKKVIIVALLLMFIIPLFDTQIYTDQANSYDYILSTLNMMLEKSESEIPLNQINDWVNNAITDHTDETLYIISFSTPYNQLPYYKIDNYENIRVSDFIVSFYNITIEKIAKTRPGLTLRGNITDQLEKTSLYCILNQASYSASQSYMSLARTLFICVLLICLLYYFNKDIEELIVQPIEQMMEKLKKMAEDPEAASKEQIDTNAQLQTTVVSNAIIKIGALLSIVFGSAGAEIIGKNIVQEGDMNPMLEGKKKCAIFGFCDIRKFTQINEILEQDILKFVNKISSIVHKAVYRYGGSANKNIGEAFLLVWKIPEGDYSIKNENNEITWHNKEYLSILADFSVYSFIKILVKINKSPEVLEYRNDYRLIEKIPGYKVEMGFGLHIGWAIEGAIGSAYKIDASYLSPNVNMASRLQAATKQFGVNFLISESLHDVLTPEMQGFCRNIDRVTVKGSNKPIRLYTVDMNLDNLTPPQDKLVKYPNIPDYQPDIELKRDINLQFMKPEEMKNYNAEIFVKSKKEFREVLINAVPGDFKKRFDQGVKSYLQGKWADAKLHFTHAQKIRSNDGPTKRLLNYMKNYDFIAPATWKNYRELTSK